MKIWQLGKVVDLSPKSTSTKCPPHTPWSSYSAYKSRDERRQRLSRDVRESHDVIEGLEAQLDDGTGTAPVHADAAEKPDGCADGVCLKCVRVPANYVPVVLVTRQ